MRWVVLTLSLGAAIVSTLHGIFEILVSSTADGAFTWVAAALLIGSALFALAGGVVALHWRRAGGIFLAISALMCFFAHRDAVIYAGFYLAGAALCVFIHAPEDYEEDEKTDEDDPEMDDGEEDDGYLQERKDGRFPSTAKKKERAAGIRGEREERDLGSIRRGVRFSQPVRVRSSKVCPACGASVGIEHKFCFTCGCPLHTPSLDASEAVIAEESERGPQLFTSPARDRDNEMPRQDGFGRPREFRSRDFQKERFLGQTDEDEDEEDDELSPSPVSEEMGVRAPAASENKKGPHRVYIPSAEDDQQPVHGRPLIVDPDNSYQEFSAYARRRKRKRRSALRRLMGPLVLLLAVVVAGWFLLGLRKLPPEALPMQPPVKDPVPPAVASSDLPIAEPMPVRRALDSLRIDIPSRGVVVGTNVNVRPDHSTVGAIVMRVNSSTKVELLEQWDGVSGSLTGPWYRIRANGKEGWVYGQYFQPLDARDTTLPFGYTAELLASFGTDRATMTGQLGQPGSQTATTLSWSGLTANLRDGDLTRLQLTSAKYVLKNGVAVGITDDQLFKAVGYPSEYRSGQLRYIESGSVGMSVSLKNRRVENVTVGNI